MDKGCGIGCGAGILLAEVNVDIQAQLWEVLLVQWDGDLAYDVSCLSRCCFHKAICSSREDQLAIMAEAETPTTAFVSMRSPCCFNCAVAGLWDAGEISWWQAVDLYLTGCETEC